MWAQLLLRLLPECVRVFVCVCVPDIYRVRCTGCWILLTLPAHSLVRSALEAHFNGFYGKAKNINQMGKYYWQNMRLPRCDFCRTALSPLPLSHFWFQSAFAAPPSLSCFHLAARIKFPMKFSDKAEKRCNKYTETDTHRLVQGRAAAN